MISNELKETARKSDLFGYMLTNHGDDITKEGSAYARLKSNHHIVLKSGFAGYYDNENGTSGNPIDFLIKNYGYSFRDAVMALTGGDVNAPTATARATEPETPRTTTEIPVWNQPTDKPFKRIFAYLIRERCIPSDVVSMLCHQHKLYQDNSGNCVFYSEEEGVREIRGTNTLIENKFRPIYRPSKSSFWSFGASDPQWIYVCEAAIDAVSLYVLCGKPDSVLFVSMAGCENQAIIDRLKATGKPVVICTDNDAKGNAVRQRNPDCMTITPKNKDFNDDLKERR